MRCIIVGFCCLILMLSDIAYSCNMAAMLQWEYGPFTGVNSLVVRNNQTIIYWNHTSIAKPNDSQIIAGCNEYAFPVTRDNKIAEIKDEAKTLVEAIFPALTDMDKIKLHKETLDDLEIVGKTLSAEQEWLRDMWNTGKGYLNTMNTYTSTPQFSNISTAWPNL